jgi:predicted nucleic acid-binding Zn ribbon protein
MVEKLLQHKHCRICEKAIPFEEEFCSEECKTKWNIILKRRKWTMYFFYGIVILFIVLLLLSGLRG